MSNKIVTNKFKKVPNDFAVSLLKFEEVAKAKISSNYTNSNWDLVDAYIQKVLPYFIAEIRVNNIFKKKKNIS